MENHYRTLGIRASASAEEVRRAYRILARRYHPDVNPGKDSAARFRKIAAAYDILSDPEKREKYDKTLEAGSQSRPNAEEIFRQYQEQQRRRDSSRRSQRPSAAPSPNGIISPSGVMLRESLGRFTQKMRTLLGKKRTRNSISALSVIEVTLSAKEAAYGVKKVIELTDEGRRRRVTVDISPGVRTGSVVRLQSKKDRAEELLAIVRVLPHPILSFTNKGVTAEIPISVREAIEGANITIPGFEETLTIRIPPGTQSGAELRVAERGVLRKDGSRGDLFVRLLIRIPESPEAVGLKEKIRELDVYYEAPVRKNFKSSLFDM